MQKRVESVQQSSYDSAKPEFANVQYGTEVPDQGLNKLIGEWHSVQVMESWERRYTEQQLGMQSFWAHKDKWIGKDSSSSTLELSKDGMYSFSRAISGQKEKQEHSGKWECKNGILLLSTTSGKILKRVLWHSSDEFEIRDCNGFPVSPEARKEKTEKHYVSCDTYTRNGLVLKVESEVSDGKVCSSVKTYVTPEAYVRSGKSPEVQYTYLEGTAEVRRLGVSKVLAKNARVYIGNRSRQFKLIPRDVAKVSVLSFSSFRSAYESSCFSDGFAFFESELLDAYTSHTILDMMVEMCHSVPSQWASLMGVSSDAELTVDLGMSKMGELRVGLFGECEVTERVVAAVSSQEVPATTREYVFADGPYNVDVEFPQYSYKVSKVARGKVSSVPLPQVDKDRDVDVTMRFSYYGNGKTTPQTKALIDIVKNKVFKRKVRLYADAVPPPPGSAANKDIKIVHLGEPKAPYVVRSWRPNEDKAKASFVVLIESESKTAFDIDKVVRTKIVERLLSEYKLKNPDAHALSVGVFVSDCELKNGDELHYIASVVSYEPVPESLSYDTNTRRGSVSVKIASANMAGARKWALQNIESVIKTKDVVLEAGRAPPANAKYRCLGETFKGSVFTIQFEAVE